MFIDDLMIKFKYYLDKRQFERVDSQRNVMIRGRKYPVKTSNISAGGVALDNYLDDVEKGDRLKLKLQLNQNEELRMWARVIRNDREKKECALSFRNPPKYAKRNLNWFVAVRSS